MVKLNPLISIIMPSFNHGSYIASSIESILNQTFSDFELLIWDDASTDNSVDIINKYSDPRIKLYIGSENLGASNIVNQMIFDHAQTEYICIANSDDVWHPMKLGRQYKFLENNKNISAVFVRPLLINSAGIEIESHPINQIFSQGNKSRHEWLNHFFYNGNCLCHPSVMIRKSCYLDIGGYDETLLQLPDFDLWVRLCKKYEIYLMDERLIKYRILDNLSNVSANTDSIRLRSIFEMEVIISRFKENLNQEDFSKIFNTKSLPICNFIENSNIEFIFSMLCLGSETQFYHWRNGLMTLLSLMENDIVRKSLAENYNFKLKDFHRLSGIFDYSSQISLKNNYNEINNLNEKINSLNNLTSGY